MTDNKDDWTPERTELDEFLERKELAESEQQLDTSLTTEFTPAMYGQRMGNANKVILDALRTNMNGFFIKEARVNFEPQEYISSFHGMMGIPRMGPAHQDVELNISVQDPELIAKIQHAMNGYYS